MARVDIEKTIAENITALRRELGLTQAALAEKLGYSDKSISKWERGESTPDIICLKRMADLFGITVDELITPNATITEPKEAAPQPEKVLVNHRAVTLIALIGVWLVALVVMLAGIVADRVLLLPPVIAWPVSAVMLIVFDAVWNRSRRSFWYVTLLCWGILFLICYIIGKPNAWLLMVLGIPATGIVWLAHRIKPKKNEREV